MVSIICNFQLFGEVPSWLCFMISASTLLYLNLDNIDGKQARKTRSSSPLGLLFDHGCDAIVTTILALNTCIIMQIGNGIQSVIAFLMGAIPFFTATWEEYYMNGLNLPIIHGASEGIVAISIIYGITGVLGTSIWTEHTFNSSIINSHFFVYLMSTLAILSALMNFGTVFFKHYENGWKKAKDLIPIFVFTAVFLIVYFFSIENFTSHNMQAIIYFFGINFAHLMTSLQLAHVANEPFSGTPWSSIVLYTILVGHTLISYLLGFSLLISGQTLLYILIGVAALVYLHFVVNVSLQCTEVLGIRVFSIQKRREEEAKPDHFI
eukprot:TRINITY_DN713_c0_g1_i1.p1 TRINITY_DN713_c0_g1~~TRINITY_DN713_c0_g1_i1.p1  ORF type:complete len:322 (+),score=24.38 TRINITY_DN713_c0_g1_i1:386-1351(+)